MLFAQKKIAFPEEPEMLKRPVEVVMTKMGPVTEPATGEWLERYRIHLLDRAYMSGIERDVVRVKATAEVFTPDELVAELVKKTGLRRINNPKKRIIDPTCGDGQFLAYILYCRLRARVPLLIALDTLYGIEKQKDNYELCKERLRCGHDDPSGDVFKTVERNIVKANARTYHMRFDGSRPPRKPKQMKLGL